MGLQRFSFGKLARQALIDVALTCVCLCAFALFHHVLPQSGGEPLAVIATATPAVAEATVAVAAEATVTVTAEATVAVTARATAAPSDTATYGKGGGGRDRGASSGEKGGSAGEDVDTAVEPVEDVSLAEKWAAFFTDEIVSTADSYSSPDVSISLTEGTLQAGSGEIVYHIADIHLADVTCLQTALAQDTYGVGYRESIPDMAAENGALLAVNGDYYGNTNEGVVIRNGVAYRANATDCDVCVLYQSGVMSTLSGASFSLDEAVSNGAWQAWTFGPALLTADGKAISTFNTTNRLAGVNPRTAIGYYEPGHYCLVTVDGRGESVGATLAQLSQLFESLGCKAAYNLDGGNSSVMVFGGQTVNEPSGGGRESSDCILIKEANAL